MTRHLSEGPGAWISQRGLLRGVAAVVGGLACATVVVLAVEFFRSPAAELHRPTLVVNAAFGALAALLIGGLAIHTRGGSRLDLASPLVYFSILFSFHFLVRPVSVWHLDELSLKSVTFFSRYQAAVYFGKAVAALVVFLLLVLGGHFLTRRVLEEVSPTASGGGTRGPEEVRPRDVRVLGRLAVGFLAVGAIGAAIIVVSNPTVLTGAIDRNYYVQTTFGRLGYVLLLVLTPVPAAAYLYGLESRRSRGSLSMGTVAIMVGLVLSSLWLASIHRSRGMLIGMVMSLLVAHSVRRRRLGVRSTVAACVGIAGMLLLWNAWESPELLTSSLPRRGLNLVATGGSYFDNLVEVIRGISWGIDHDYGYHFLGVVFDFLPAEMRPIAGSERFTEIFFPRVYRQGVGRAGPMISEFYWSFGLAGVAGLGLLTGGVFGVVDRWRERLALRRFSRQELWGALLYSVLLPSFAGIAFGSFTKWVPVMLVNLLILAPVLYCHGRARRSRRRSDAVLPEGGAGGAT